MGTELNGQSSSVLMEGELRKNIYTLLIAALVIFGAALGVLNAKSSPTKGQESDPRHEHENTLITFKDPFAVPVIKGGKIDGVIIIGITLEIKHNKNVDVRSMEPILRSSILSALFNHSNSGYFSENFIEKEKLAQLEGEINKASIKSNTEIHITKTLITNIYRQNT